MLLNSKIYQYCVLNMCRNMCRNIKLKLHIIFAELTIYCVSSDYPKLSLDYPWIIIFFPDLGCPGFLYNFQLCGGYSLFSDWPASVGKSLLIVPLLTYTTQVSEYLGHTSLNPDQIISACPGSGLPPSFSS